MTTTVEDRAVDMVIPVASMPLDTLVVTIHVVVIGIDLTADLKIVIENTHSLAWAE